MMNKVEIQDLQDWLEAIQMDDNPDNLARPAKRTDLLELIPDGEGLQVTDKPFLYIRFDE